MPVAPWGPEGLTPVRTGNESRSRGAVASARSPLRRSSSGCSSTGSVSATSDAAAVVQHRLPRLPSSTGAADGPVGSHNNHPSRLQRASSAAEHSSERLAAAATLTPEGEALDPGPLPGSPLRLMSSGATMGWQQGMVDASMGRLPEKQGSSLPHSGGSMLNLLLPASASNHPPSAAALTDAVVQQLEAPPGARGLAAIAALAALAAGEQAGSALAVAQAQEQVRAAAEVRMGGCEDQRTRMQQLPGCRHQA
jgi:hypothetical protein